MSTSNIATITQVACEAQSEKKLSKKELQDIRRKELAAKIREKQRKLEELRAVSKEPASTDEGSTSDGEHDPGSSDESSNGDAANLRVSAKAFYPPPGLESPSAFSVDAMASANDVQYECIPLQTKLNKNARMFKSNADPSRTKLSATASLFQPSMLKAQGVPGYYEKVSWVSSQRMA